MKNFDIDPKYFTSVNVHEEKRKYRGKKELTPQELIEVIKGEDLLWSMISTKDHPEFEKLRNELARQGYIEKFEGVWNCDTVLKHFSLNNILEFKPDDTFYSAGAMHYDWEHAKKNKKENNDN